MLQWRRRGVLIRSMGQIWPLGWKSSAARAGWAARDSRSEEQPPPQLKREQSTVCPSLRRISERLTALNFPVCPAYDWSKATNENYELAARRWWGPFQSIRETLDYDYHGNYTQERQALQDKLIGDVVRAGAGERHAPWVVFTAGAMGAGKSHVINCLSTRGVFPLSDIVAVDPDVFRQRLPEWQGYLERDGATAGMLTHKEAGQQYASHTNKIQTPRPSGC